MNDFPNTADPRQKALFRQVPHAVTPADPNSCNIVSVGKRRDGGTRFWCQVHKADATAKYGVAAPVCKSPQFAPALEEDTFTLDLDSYPGGIALWGAVPPIYDTTEYGIDRGIHVHARPALGGPKAIDRSYRHLRIVGKHLNEPGISISELEAIYYMASSVLHTQ